MASGEKGISKPCHQYSWYFIPLVFYFVSLMSARFSTSLKLCFTKKNVKTTKNEENFQNLKTEAYEINYADWKKSHMLDITSHQSTAKQNQNEMSLHTFRTVITK